MSSYRTDDTTSGDRIERARRDMIARLDCMHLGSNDNGEDASENARADETDPVEAARARMLRRLATRR
jgi:hypothetical protein